MRLDVYLLIVVLSMIAWALIVVTAWALSRAFLWFCRQVNRLLRWRV